MANSTTLSTTLTALAESLAPALDGRSGGDFGSGPIPTPATLYPALIRARDEAVCLEARASARDASVHRLIAQVSALCDEKAILAFDPEASRYVGNA